MPGPGTEVPRDLYRAALEDALTYTIDRGGCPDCDPPQLCDTHAARATRAQQYQQALDEELVATHDCWNEKQADGPEPPEERES